MNRETENFLAFVAGALGAIALILWVMIIADLLIHL